MMRPFLLAASMLAAAIWATPGGADPLDIVLRKIQPTRAVYMLRQADDPAPGDALRLSGTSTIESRITCSEVAMSMVMEMRMTAGAQSASMRVEYQDTESRDGMNLRFSSRAVMDGREVLREEVQAVLRSRDGPGEATIAGATSEALKLEAGIVLPGTHFLRTLAAALDGTRSFEHRVFTGVAEMRLVSKRVTIVGQGRSGIGADLGEFADKPGWFIRTEQAALTGSHVGVAQSHDRFLTEEGVTTHLTLRMLGLALVGTPLSIEKLPKPDCKS